MWSAGRRYSEKNMYRYIDEDTIEIQLTRGKIGYIDAEDIDLLDKYTWSIEECGRTQARDELTRTLRMHRLIIEKIHGPLETTKEVIHLNGNRADNRRGNLHITNRTGSNMRQKISTTNTTGIKGVCYRSKYNAYQGRFKYKGKEKTKMFKIDVYGRDAAKRLATEWRDKQIRLSNITI